jgi:hypothetical protein
MILRMIATLLIAICLLPVSSRAVEAITPAEIEAAQKTWGQAIVSIGETYESGGEYRALAKQSIEELYAYNLTPVLFNPTKASAEPFRPTVDSALSYFVTGSIPEDLGFALQPWTRVRFDDQAFFIQDDTAIAMGHYYFTDGHSGEETKVEFTLGYVRDEQGRLRIFLQHSSLPYVPEVRTP